MISTLFPEESSIDLATRLGRAVATKTDRVVMAACSLGEDFFNGLNMDTGEGELIRRLVEVVVHTVTSKDR